MKKISIIFLSFVIFIAPPLAYAGVGKYIIDIVKQTPNAVKVSATNTANGAKHVINHGVSSRDMSIAIGGGIVSMAVGGGVAIAFEAITGLALDAVDWVMDEENNQIKWKKKADGGGSNPEYVYRPRAGVGGAYNTPDLACRAYKDEARVKYSHVVTISPNLYSCFFDIHGTVQHNFYVDKLENRDYKPPVSVGWQTLPLETLAKKTIDLAKQGKAPAVKTIQDYVTNIAKNGDLDRELDNSTDITKSDKECSAGYEKVGSVCVKKKDKDAEECPAGTIKVGEYCMKEPDDGDTGGNTDPTECGECCEELQLILVTIAKMNNDFYENSLDNDAQMLVNLKLVNDQLDAIATDFSELLVEAKKTNQTLTEINNNQELHFNELKQKSDELKEAVETGNADILAKLAEMQVAIDLTNLKLDQVNLNLEKINDNLEKMQKCEETEFNKKICEFIDWVKQEPDSSEEDGTIDVTDKSDGLSIDKDRIKFSNQCPAPKTVSISVVGFPLSYELNYQPLCDFFIMLNPFMIAMGGISSALIIGGGVRRG